MNNEQANKAEQDIIVHDNHLCPSDTDIPITQLDTSFSLFYTSPFENNPFPISQVNLPMSSYNQNLDYVLNYGIYNVDKMHAELMLSFYSNNTVPTFLLRYTEYSNQLNGTEIATLTLKVNNAVFLHMNLYLDSYKSVLDTFKNNGYIYFIMPVYSIPNPSLSYVRNDILILDRDDSTRILEEDPRDNIYLLRYKKIDEHYNSNCSLVVSIKRQYKITHNIINNYELAQINKALLNYNKVKIQSTNSKNLGY